MISMRHSLILASSSSIRQQMLQRAGLRFVCCPSPANEEALKLTLQQKPISEQAAALASAKAQAISQQQPNAFVIGADQICALNGQTFGKAGSMDGAIKQLEQLSGHTHQQYSAVSLFHKGEELWSHVAIAELTMCKLTSVEIKAYVALDTPTHCAGSYKFESHGVHLFKNTTGNSHTIQGLALLPLLTALREHGVYALTQGHT